MIVVAGKAHSKRLILGIAPGLDDDGFFQDLLVKFADDHGWARGWICFEWSQLTLLRMYHAGQSQEVAEDAAVHDVFSCFRDLKLGGESD